MKMILLMALPLILAGCEQAPAADSETVNNLTLDAPREFAGNPCTEDCSGHEAGYDWAAEKGITDEADCETPSESFNEGCRTYVRESSTEE